MSNTYFEKYADLIVRNGISMNKGEVVVISGQVEIAHFVKIVVKKAYDLGAKKVIVDWADEELTKMMLVNESEEVLEEQPTYVKEKYNYFKDNKVSFIYLAGGDPHALDGVDPAKIMLRNKTVREMSREISDMRMTDELKWTIAGIPTKKWAQKVFPNEENAYEKLWVEVLKTVRVDQEDTVKAWDEHTEKLKMYGEYLNNAKFDKIVFKNDLGTDLEVGLPKGYIFNGGGSSSTSGEWFLPNMPTEEVFSLPHKEKVSGVVFSSKPLNYSGTIIDEFWLMFEEGKVISFDAKKGKDMLERLLDSDEGAKMLGEVAIVNYDSPISQSNILYYNTLFDENASCHVALGKAYPTCLEGSEKMTEKELDKAGVNDSSIHVDFMFGTSDMTITGIKGDEEVVFFKDGNFVEEIVCKA